MDNLLTVAFEAHILRARVLFCVMDLVGACAIAVRAEAADRVCLLDYSLQGLLGYRLTLDSVLDQLHLFWGVSREERRSRERTQRIDGVMVAVDLTDRQKSNVSQSRVLVDSGV